MSRRYLHLHIHSIRIEAFVSAVIMCIIGTTGQSAAVTRFLNRSLLVNTNEPGATSIYTVTLGYNSITAIGSLDMLFCNDPIPTDPCDAPLGLDVSGAVLSSQTGETNFTLHILSPNHLVLSRPPALVGSETSSYTLSNIINPTDSTQSFAIRLSDYASSDASGPLIDLGSVVSQTEPGIGLETQVPPILIFCVAQQVTDDCTQGSGGNYSDLGELSSTQTLTTTSQMAVGTNASSGYVITVNGDTLYAGTHGIAALPTPTPSIPGVNQFGINLVMNNNPQIGADPDGGSTNTALGSNYAIPNQFTFKDGDEVASAPNVSLVKRYTVSYIINSAANLKPGVYTTTLTFICSGRF